MQPYFYRCFCRKHCCTDGKLTLVSIILVVQVVEFFQIFFQQKVEELTATVVTAVAAVQELGAAVQAIKEGQAEIQRQNRDVMRLMESSALAAARSTAMNANVAVSHCV